METCKICGRYCQCQRRDGEGDYLCPKHYRQIYFYGKILETRFDRNKIEEKDDYAEIILVSQIKGEDVKEIARAKIDKEDIDKVNPYKWHIKDNTYFSKKFNKLIHKFYVTGRINKRETQLSRFLLNPRDDEDVDHISGDGLDNRKCNLRKCTAFENMRNQKMRIDNISGTTGVWYRKDRNKWISERRVSTIIIDGKEVVLEKPLKIIRESDTIEEAKQTYKETEKYHGEFVPKEEKDEKNEPQPIP